MVTRSFTTAGFDPAKVSGLPLSPAPAVDNVTVPCALAGSPVTYRVGPLHWSPTVTVTQQPRIELGVMDHVLGQVEMPAFDDHAYGAPIKAYPKFDLTSSGHTSQLGSLQPNNVKPTIDEMSFFATAGTPKTLSADVSGPCEVASYSWTFSDGTVAYGAHPVKTFSKSVSGRLKVTDTSGLTATRDFNVVVS
jgi:hypothetical protein